MMWDTSRVILGSRIYKKFLCFFFCYVEPVGPLTQFTLFTLTWYCYHTYIIFPVTGILFYHFTCKRSQDSSLSVVTGLRAGWPRFNPGRGWGFFSFPSSPDRFWSPPTSNPILGGEAAWG